MQTANYSELDEAWRRRIAADQARETDESGWHAHNRMDGDARHERPSRHLTGREAFVICIGLAIAGTAAVGFVTYTGQLLGWW